MKTYKQLQESIKKALLKFGQKGIRKVQPNVVWREAGKTVKKFNPDIDLKQFNRVSQLKDKYQNLNTDYLKSLFMKQKVTGVERGVDRFAINKGPTVVDKIGAQIKKRGKHKFPPNADPLIKKLDANVKSSENYINRRKDAMQGFKPTEVGPNTSSVQTPPLSTGKGEKSRKRALKLMLTKIKEP